jgi:uncharacterized protein (DUF1499 family)
MMRPTRKQMLTSLAIGLGLIAAFLLAVAAVLLANVENWRRDLTTNVATTDENSPDERLRPLKSSVPPEALADRVAAAVRPLPNWKLTARTTNADRVEIHFVRTTSLWRFKDDIHARIEPTPSGGSLLTATSRSRIGKADLGQNPRNLRQLLAAVRKAAE